MVAWAGILRVLARVRSSRAVSPRVAMGEDWAFEAWGCGWQGEPVLELPDRGPAPEEPVPDEPVLEELMLEELVLEEPAPEDLLPLLDGKTIAEVTEISSLIKAFFEMGP